MQDFASNMQRAANSPEPVAIKMSRKVRIYDNITQKWIERENFIRFTNNAYENVSK